MAPEAEGNDTGRTIVGLVKRAEQGDEQALAELGPVFDAAPSLLAELGDLAATVQDGWIQLLAGSNLLRGEATRRKTSAMREELAGPSPTPIERLLVERVVACWLAVQHAEVRYTEALRAEGVSFELSEYHQRRCERAQRRYLAAIKALAQVRRLLVPMVQVNIAERQVNLAHGIPPAPSGGGGRGGGTLPVPETSRCGRTASGRLPGWRQAPRPRP